MMIFFFVVPLCIGAPPLASSLSSVPALSVPMEKKALGVGSPPLSGHEPRTPETRSPTTAMSKEAPHCTWGEETSGRRGHKEGKGEGEQEERDGLSTGRVPGTLLENEPAVPRRPREEGRASGGMATVLEAFKDVLVRTESIERKELQRSLMEVLCFLLTPLDLIHRTLRLAATMVPPLFSDLLLQIRDAASLQRAGRLFAAEHQSRLAILHEYAKIPLQRFLDRPTLNPLAERCPPPLPSSFSLSKGRVSASEMAKAMQAEEWNAPFHLFWMREEKTMGANAEDAPGDQHGKAYDEEGGRSKDDGVASMATTDRVALAEATSGGGVAMAVQTHRRGGDSGRPGTAAHSEAHGQEERQKGKEPKIPQTSLEGTDSGHRSGTTARPISTSPSGGRHPHPSLAGLPLSERDIDSHATHLRPANPGAPSSSEMTEVETLRLHGYDPHAFPPPLARPLASSASSSLLSSTEGGPRVVPYTVLSSLQLEPLPFPSSAAVLSVNVATTPTPATLSLCSTLRVPIQGPTLLSVPRRSTDDDVATFSPTEGKRNDGRIPLVFRAGTSRRGREDPASGEALSVGERQSRGGRAKMPIPHAFGHGGTAKERRSSSPMTSEGTPLSAALPGWSRQGPSRPLLPSSSSPPPFISRQPTGGCSPSLPHPPALVSLPSASPPTEEGFLPAGTLQISSSGNGVTMARSTEGLPRMPAKARERRSADGLPSRGETRADPSEGGRWAGRTEPVGSPAKGEMDAGEPFRIPGTEKSTAEDRVPFTLPPLYHEEDEDANGVASEEEEEKKIHSNATEGLEPFPAVRGSSSRASSSWSSRTFDSVASSTWSSIWQQTGDRSNAFPLSSPSDPHTVRVGAIPHRRFLLFPSPLSLNALGVTPEGHGPTWIGAPFYGLAGKKRGEGNHCLPGGSLVDIASPSSSSSSAFSFSPSPPSPPPRTRIAFSDDLFLRFAKDLHLCNPDELPMARPSVISATTAGEGEQKNE